MKTKYILLALALFLLSAASFSQCLSPTNLTVTNVTSNSATVSWNGNADSYTVWYGTPPSTSHYLGYGEMTLQGALGNDSESTWTWGVMFPGESVPGNVLTKVGFFNTVNNINDITIRVYSGGDNAPGTLLLTKVVTAIPNSYQLVVLDAPLHLPSGENLWITLEETGIWLMSMTNATDPNSRWYFDGNAWTQQSVYPDKGWIIHGHVENQDYENISWNQVATTNQSIELTGLTPETTYDVRVFSHCNQGYDSEMSESVSFITRAFACPTPTNLAVGGITHNSADLNWNGESDSYKVLYRPRIYAQGPLEVFPTTTIPSGWSQKSGLLGEVLPGQSSLTDGSAWEFGENDNVFDSHAKLSLVPNVHHWLISPTVAIANNNILNFDIALTVYSYHGPYDLFAVLVQDVDSGQWSLLRQWNNQGPSYVLQDISQTGENVSVDLSAYAGKNVRIAFYGERSDDFPWNVQIHIDNVCVGAPVPEGEWQTAVNNHPGTSYTLTGLDPETPYEAKVKGVCGGAESSEMSAVNFTTSYCIQVPTDVTVSDIDYFSANLGWTENSTATAWQIQLNDEPPMAVITNPYTLTNLNPNTEYTVKVRSQQGEYFSNWSVAANFTTLFYCYPPTQLTLVKGTIDSATLAWTDLGTATEWQLCINGEEANLVTVNTNQYVMTNLDAQTQYTVKVRSVCGETYTEWSNELSFTPVLYCNPPTLSVSNVTTTTADLSWTEIPGANSYSIILNTPPTGGSYPIITNYTATQGTAGVNPNEGYNKLVDNYETTKWCAVMGNEGVFVEFQSETAFIPSSYILTTGNDNATCVGRNPMDWTINAKLHLDDPWTIIDSVTDNHVMQNVNYTDYEFELNNTNAYRYFRFEVSAVQSADAFQLSELKFRGQVISYNVTSTSLQLTNLTPGTDYSARVFGNIGEMSTNWSNEVNFTTSFVAPINLTATSMTYSSVVLAWTDNNGIPGWQICLNDDETNLIDASTNPFILTGLTQQTQYTVKVRASHEGNVSDWSESINFTTKSLYQEPTDLAVTEIHSDHVILNWTENSDATEWRICLNGDMTNLITVDSRPYTLDGLTPESAYTVKISAYHDGLFSDWSNSISFTTLVLTPSLTVSNVNQTSANLNWTRTSGANYTVRYNRIPTALETVIFTGYENGSSNWAYGYMGSQPTSSMVNNTSHSGSYSFQFVANSGTNAQFQVSPSFEDCFYLEFYYKTNNTSETFQILFDIGNNNQSSTEEISVNTNGQWQKFTCDIPQNITKLRIKYCSQSQSALWIDDIVIASDHLTVETNTNSAQLTGLVPGDTYSVKVQTKHGVHYSEWSDAVEFTTYDPPTNLTVSNLAETVATIGWTENGNATQWQLCLNNDQNNLIAVNTNPFTLEGLTQETHYTVKVRDCYEGVYSAWSDAIGFTTLAYCAAPTDLAVDDIMRHSATLSWNANSDSYKVFYRTTGEWILAAENLSETTFTLTGLDAKTHYEACVKGVCNGIESNASNSIDFYTLLDNVPTLTVDDITCTSAGLFWTETPGADSYTVSLNNSIEIPVNSGYTADTANPEGSNNERYTNLVDNNKNSKWFVNKNDGNGHFAGCYIEFHSQHVFIPTGYVLTTASDTDNSGTHPGRNPKSWVIKAKLNAEDEWTTIESVTDNYVMQNEPLTDYNFSLDNNEPYRYFRFEVSDVQSGYRFQLGEMRFLGDSKNSVYLTDLEPATAYSAKVRAKIGEINGEWSDEVNFSTLYLTPTNLTVTNLDYTSVTLDWTENGGANHWQLCLNDDEDNLIDADSNPFTITGLTQHSDYTAKVRVKQGEGYSSWSDIVRFATLFDVISPTLTVNNVTSTSADLNWTEIIGVDGYTVSLNDAIVSFPSQIITGYTATSGAGGYNTNEDYANLVDNDRSTKWCRKMENVYIEFHSESRFVPTGYILTTGSDNATAHGRNPKDWVIKAKLKVGDPWTTIATVTNDQVLQDVNTTDFEFAIDNHLPYRYFRFEVSANHGNDSFQLGEFRFLGYVPTNSLHLTNLLPETDYTVKVRCDQEGIHSEWSNTVNFRTLYLPPTELTVSDIDHCSATLGWTSNSNIAQWQICLNGDEDHLILTNANPYTLTGLDQHTHYTVKVRNHQEGADDAWSDEIGFTTLFNIIAPTVTVNNITLTTAILNWEEIIGADGYTVSVNDSIIPNPIITGYTATKGTSGYSGENYPNLVDNDRSTKWCVGQSNNIYIEFNTTSSFIPTGYVLTTGNDANHNPQRNPKDWVIKAKLNAGDAWTTIDSITNDNVLQAKDTTDYEFAIDNHAVYRYFRFEVKAVQNGDSFQLGELRFRGKTLANSLHLTNLLPETDYAVKVRGDFGETHSEWSNTVNFRTLYLPPTNLTVSDIGYNSATLGWAANSNITQWQICLNGDEENLIMVNTNPYILTGLDQHTHYTVKVRNHQEGADDAWSNEIGFTTLFNIIAPTVTVNNITLTTAILNWEEIIGADGYTVSVNDSIIPDPIITSYTVTDGTNGYSDNEGCAKLVDNDRSTKWCRWSNNIYIEFNSQHDFIPTGYVLTTAADAQKNPQRNPKDWVIKAKLNDGDEWTTIATVTNDNVLQAKDTTDYEFAIDNHLPYRYFRFEVSAVQSGDSFQLGELRFRGKTPTNSRTLTGLLPETEYAIKVRADFGDAFSVWSEEVSFVTFDGITFFVNGNWNDPDKWNISRVPGADDDVYIVAQAVVPAGYTAQVKQANVNDGGSITIEDSGQFIAENEVKVAMRKNISAWTTDPVGGWYFIVSPVNTEDSDYSVTGLISEIEGKDYDLYQLNATVWENYKAEGSHYQFALEQGRGYLYASENGTEIEFNGNTVPYDETSIPLSDGFNLVGNPYTFNTYVNRPYYKLNSDRTDIELVNDNLVIAPCEGVLIEAEGADEVIFTKTNQLAQATNNGNLNIAVAHQASSRGVAATSDKAVVSFNEGGQLGKFYFMQQDANIYIPQDGKDFAIAFSKKQGEMPLCFKAMKNGKYTITVAPENVKVGYLHLIDNLTGTDVDLLATSSYTFEGRTDDYVSRFKLVFIAYDNADNDDFAFISNGDIIINGKGLIQVVDVLGRTVLSKNLLNSTSHLSTLTLKSGVYVLRLVKGREVKTQKIILP